MTVRSWPTQIPDGTLVIVNHDPALGHSCRHAGRVTCHTKGGMRLATIDPQAENFYPRFRVTTASGDIKQADEIPLVRDENDKDVYARVRFINKTPQGLANDLIGYGNCADDNPRATRANPTESYTHPMHMFDDNRRSRVAAGLPR